MKMRANSPNVPADLNNLAEANINLNNQNFA